MTSDAWDESAWLIETTGPQYLALDERQLCFRWTANHSEAFRFARMIDAGSMMQVARTFMPELFDSQHRWEHTKAIEHMWIG